MEREKLISLVTNAQKSDPDALSELFNAFYNDVYYFALKVVKDEDTACDITQDTFVEIINTIDKLQEPAAFVKWMKTITYHRCTRYFKKKKDVIVDEDEDGNTIFDTLQEEKADFIPDEALDKADFKQTIMAMIDALTEEQRAAVMMFYFDELTIKQIAEIQGTNENTVKSRLNYAKKGIKKSVEDYEKKNGVKLHCAGVLPLLLWLFRDYFAQTAPASAAVVAQSVAAATGTAVTATGTTAAATTAAVGAGAKIASVPFATKIIAGVVAAAIAVGGATTAAVLSTREQNPTDSSTVASEEASVPTDPPTEPPTEPDALYYDPARISDSTLTIEDLGTLALANAENVAGEDFGDPKNAIYSVDYAASCFKDMDIFGYGVTVDEMLGKEWGRVDFFAYLIGENLEVQLNSASFSLRLPMENKDVLLKLATQDIGTFTALLSGRGDPYTSIAGTSKRGLDSLTNEALMKAVDGTGSSPVEIFTSDRFGTPNGREFGLSMTISSSLEDGVYYYCIGFNIYFFNN